MAGLVVSYKILLRYDIEIVLKVASLQRKHPFDIFIENNLQYSSEVGNLLETKDDKIWIYPYVLQSYEKATLTYRVVHK